MASIAHEQKPLATEVCSCGVVLRNRYSVIVTTTIVALLPRTFWSDSEIRCGDLSDVLDTGKYSKTICWSCARINKIVSQSEEAHSEEQSLYQNCKLKWEA